MSGYEYKDRIKEKDEREFNRVFHKETNYEPDSINNRFKEIDLLINTSDYFDISQKNERDYFSKNGKIMSSEHKCFLINNTTGILNYSDNFETVKNKIKFLFEIDN
jgi:hypothetical protein